MRPADLQQAIEACRTIVDGMQVAAAQEGTSLTPAERRHLLAIAAAIQALLEPPIATSTITTQLEIRT